jgi:hypothetical protein
VRDLGKEVGYLKAGRDAIAVQARIQVREVLLYGGLSGTDCRKMSRFQHIPCVFIPYMA